MAIVFISPKQRQRRFFIIIIGGFSLLVIIISLFVFLAKPKKVSPDLVFNRPKIDIDLKVLDSPMVKNLDPAVKMDFQYAYMATTAKGVKTSGIITAASLDDAQKILQGMKYAGITIKEAGVGRSNPFSPYTGQTEEIFSSSSSSE